MNNIKRFFVNFFSDDWVPPSQVVEYIEVTANEAIIPYNSIGKYLNNYARLGWSVKQILKEDEIGGAKVNTYLLEREK